jgi:hypothetical protein
MRPCGKTRSRRYARSLDWLLHVFHDYPVLRDNAECTRPVAFAMQRYSPVTISGIKGDLGSVWSPSGFQPAPTHLHVSLWFAPQTDVLLLPSRPSLLAPGCRKPFPLRRPILSEQCLARAEHRSCRVGAGYDPWQVSDATTIPCLRAMMGDALAPAAELA